MYDLLAGLCSGVLQEKETIEAALQKSEKFLLAECICKIMGDLASSDLTISAFAVVLERKDEAGAY